MAEPKLATVKRVQFARSDTLDSLDDRLRFDGSDQPATTSRSSEETPAPDSTVSQNDNEVSPAVPIGGQIDDDEDVEAAKKLAVELQLEMLRGKLARRNQIIEVIRRAYYHDVIVVKEELRTGSKQPSSSASVDDRLSSVPSVDLRDVLPLFAPSETVLRVHPCDTCGGHLELVHGESKELQAARQEMVRASKGEQQMRIVVHRMRTEAKEMEEVNEALQQRVKALLKENAYTLEQLQSARKNEREQKTTIANLRSKLQLAQATQDEIDRLAIEFKDIKQQLIRSNHDRDIFSASNNHLKEELAEVTKALHSVKVEKAQLESDFGTSYYRLQEELKKSSQLSEDLATTQTQLKDKILLSDELQRSLSLLKEELATTIQRFEQTKRHLEDQLIEEERAREELQEQNLEFRKMNKKLTKDIEKNQGLGNGGSDQRGSSQERAVRGKGASDGRFEGEVSSHTGIPPVRGAGRNRIESLLLQLERSQMRENDLFGALSRALTAATTKPAPMRRQLSRMPSTTVITRFVPVDGGGDNKMQGGATRTTGNTTGSTGEGGKRNTVGEGINGSRTLPVSEDMAEEDSLGSLEINEKNFEAYHQEVHRMLTEIEDGKDKISKQQKVITDMERKNHGLTDRLEEAKLTIEALTGSVNALKMRLNQDSAGAAEQLEAMMHQIEDGKRDRQFEVDKVVILMEFVRSVSQKIHALCDNSVLLDEIDSEIVPGSEEERATFVDDGLQMAELQRKKRELRRKVLMEKGLQKLSQQCYNRAGLIGIELQRFQESSERLREDLDQAENKIDSGMLQIRTLDAELAKLRLTVEMGKANVAKTEKALRIATSDLQEAQAKCSAQSLELATLAANCEKLREDEKRLTMMLFEKTKSWEKEVTTSNKRMEQLGRLQAKVDDLTAERDDLLARLKEIDDLAEYRRRTNCSIGISAIPETTESEMQTDRWKPQGLILRQRNGADRMPQRYLGKASVMIACPELSKLPSPRNLNQESTSWLPDGEVLSSSMAPLPRPESEELARGPGLVEMNIYPSARVGGRQVKTSHSGARPKALSKLFLSSDGISQRYQAVASDESSGTAPLPGKRPATTM